MRKPCQHPGGQRDQNRTRAVGKAAHVVAVASDLPASGQQRTLSIQALCTFHDPTIILNEWAHARCR